MCVAFNISFDILLNDPLLCKMGRIRRQKNAKKSLTMHMDARYMPHVMILIQYLYFECVSWHCVYKLECWTFARDFPAL